MKKVSLMTKSLFVGALMLNYQTELPALSRQEAELIQAGIALVILTGSAVAGPFLKDALDAYLTKQASAKAARAILKKNQVFQGGLSLSNEEKTLVNDAISCIQYNRPFDGGGILFYGVPGNGKTLTARYIAMKSQATLMQVNPSDLFKMGHHNSIKPSPAAALEAIFQAAFEHRSSTQKPVIIFFDEVDFAGRKRTTTADLEVTTLTAELLLQTAEAAKRKGIYLMAATNYFDNLDEALKRDGRFGKHVCLKNPEIETIQALITNATSNTSSSDVVQRVAQKALGLSKAAIVESMQKAATGCLVTGLIKSDTESSIASSFLSKLSGLWKQQNQKDGGDDLIIKAVTQAPEAFWRYLIQSFEDKVSILKKV